MNSRAAQLSRLPRESHTLATLVREYQTLEHVLDLVAAREAPDWAFDLIAHTEWTRPLLTAALQRYAAERLQTAAERIHDAVRSTQEGA